MYTQHWKYVGSFLSVKSTQFSRFSLSGSCNWYYIAPAFFLWHVNLKVFLITPYMEMHHLNLTYITGITDFYTLHEIFHFAWCAQGISQDSECRAGFMFRYFLMYFSLLFSHEMDIVSNIPQRQLINRFASIHCCLFIPDF